MDRATIQQRLDYLQERIDHPGTSENERDACRRAYDHHAALLKTAKPSFTWEPRWKGSKYEATRGIFGMAELTAMIRADIKVARDLGRITAAPGTLAVADPIATAPAQIKITVRSPHYGSIDIVVRNIPEEWGYTMRDPYGTGEEHPYPSDALLELGCALKALGNEYNYDNSDAMTDYFDTRFYLHVIDPRGAGIDYRPRNH